MKAMTLYEVNKQDEMANVAVSFFFRFVGLKQQPSDNVKLIISRFDRRIVHRYTIGGISEQKRERDTSQSPSVSIQ